MSEIDERVQAELDALDRAREAARIAGDARAEIAALDEIAALQTARGRRQPAKTALERIGRLHERLEDVHGVAGSRYRLGLLLKDESPTDAEAHFAAALEGFHASEDHARAGRVLARMADLQLRRQDLAGADRTLEAAGRAFVLAEDIDQLLATMRSRSLLLQLRGETAAAHEIMTRALAVARQRGGLEQVLSLRMDLRNLSGVEGADPEAAESIDGLLEDMLAAGRRDLAGQAFLARGAEHVKRGNLDGALQDAQSARHIALETADPINYTLACLFIADLQEQRGDRLAVLNILFTCQASMGDLLGDAGRKPVLQVLDARRRAWGEDAWAHEIARYRAQFDRDGSG